MATQKDRALGSKIRKAMDGRKQYWLAEKLGIPDDYLSNKLNGRKSFSEIELVKIDEILGTSFSKTKVYER